MEPNLEDLMWEEVSTIILVDRKGITYRTTKQDLLTYFKPMMAHVLMELWITLTEEASG